MGGTWLGCLHSGKVCGHKLDRQNRAARDRKNILPHETPRERFQRGEDKERAESMTNRNIRETPQPQLPPTAQGRAEEGTEIPIPAGSHHKHLHSLHNLVFFQEHPEILGISATFPLLQIFPGQIFALPPKYILHLG